MVPNTRQAFNTDGYMQRRDMSANDIPISASERRIGKEFK
jgi:nuclear transport factor 2 (NTF2) superfamily protein